MTRDPVRVAARFGALVLALVAVIGAVLSFDNLRQAAAVYVGPDLAWAFPALVDALILGCTLRYVAGLRRGRFVPGYRVLAHAGIAATVYLNALASQDAGGIPWHVAPPLAWACILELAARDALGEYQATHHLERTRIPGRLWFTQPLTAFRVALQMTRTGGRDYVAAMREISLVEAACEALRLTLPGWRALRVRRIVRRYIRRGILTPDRVLEVTGECASPGETLRAVLDDVLAARAPKPRRTRKPDDERAHDTEDTRDDERAPEPPPLALTDEQMALPEIERARAVWNLALVHGVKVTAPQIAEVAAITATHSTIRRWMGAFRDGPQRPDPTVEAELDDLLSRDREPADA